MKTDAEKLCEALLENADLLSQNQVLELKNSNLEQENSWLKRQVFGGKSERVADLSNSESLQTELNLFGEPIEIPGVLDSETKSVTHKRKQPENKKNRNPIPDSIACEEIIVEPSKEEKTCSSCGKEKVEIGREENKVLDYIPAHFVAKNYIRPKYACKCCPENGVTIAATPNRPIDKGLAESGLLTHVSVSKYVDHLPLYRQSQIFGRFGIIISRSTMNGWIDKMHQMLEPILLRMKERMIASEYIQADETTIKVLKYSSGEKNSKLAKNLKKSHTGYLWPYTDGENIVFEYKAGRGRDGPVEFLQNFGGWLQTDGYAGYNEVVKKNKITHIMCWAHARRKFFDALDYDSERANQMILQIKKLYAVEREAHEVCETFEERGDLRQQKSLPILWDIKVILDKYRAEVLPQSPIGKAVNYALNHWIQLSKFVENGKVEIDNNRIENKIRPVAIGRKNWLFAGSEAGAQRAALFYTLFGSCKIHGINPFEYLKDVLERINTHPASKIDELLPAEWLKLR